MKPAVCEKCPAYKEPGPIKNQIVPNPKLIAVAEAPGA